MTIVSLQCMRAVAAILVVIYHHMNTMREALVPGLPRFDVGEFGVDIFFIISGFIMWTTTAGRNTTPASFMQRRIARIVPLYWALTLVTVFVSTRGGLSVNFDVDYVRLTKSLFFVPQWNATYPNMVAPCMLPGWTLELEMLFYLVFASTLQLAPKQRVMAVLSVLGTLTIVGLGVDTHSAVLKAYTNNIMMEFGMGILLGRLHELGRLRLPPAAALGLVSIGIALVSVHSFMPKLRFLYYGVPALLLMTGVLSLETFMRGNTYRLPKFLGDASYSIYLSHLMAMAISTKLVPRALAANLTVVALVLEVCFAIAAGSLVYLFVEKPLNDAARRLLSRSRPPVLVAPALVGGGLANIEKTAPADTEKERT